MGGEVRAEYLKDVGQHQAYTDSVVTRIAVA